VPKLFVENHHPSLRPRKTWLKERAEKALPLCMASRGKGDAPLGDLEEVWSHFVSDAEIARIHGEFLGDPTPTDVITFHHGEIIISLDHARSVAPTYGHSWREEILLYMIHGLLHLNGHEDNVRTSAEVMKQKQEEILRKVLET
jgi:probable rRNA maturation factor